MLTPQIAWSAPFFTENISHHESALHFERDAGAEDADALGAGLAVGAAEPSVAALDEGAAGAASTAAPAGGVLQATRARRTGTSARALRSQGRIGAEASPNSAPARACGLASLDLGVLGEELVEGLRELLPERRLERAPAEQQAGGAERLA